jgi:hypothetical protein
MKSIASGLCALLALTPPAAASAAHNPVARETQKSGTTEWLLKNHKASRPGTDTWRWEKSIEGYCSHATIRAGQALTVFVSTS